MADLGDCGHAVRSAIVFAMAPLSSPVSGVLGCRVLKIERKRWAGTWHTTTKSPTSVVVNITDGFLGDHIALWKKPASLVEQVKVGPLGAFWYDLDDGLYYATSTTSEQAWRVEIVGATVTITNLFPPTGGGQAEPMYASVC